MPAQTPTNSGSAKIKIPPHSTEAEISVLGALLLDNSAVVSVAEFLEANHFYDEKHKYIYQCIIDLYEERSPIDILTVSEHLKKNKKLKIVGGTDYLAGLVNKVPTAAHVEHYGKIVKNHSTKRSLMTSAAKIFDIVFDEGLEADELLDKAESEIFSLTQRHITGGFTAVKTTLADSFDRLDELHKQGAGLRGIPTGFIDLDHMLAGLQKSNLIILAARPGMGKTTLAINIAQNMAVNLKRPVGVFSLEMSKEELVDRLLVSQADIDAWKLKTGKLDENDFTAFSEAMGVLAEAPLYIDDTPALSILEMRTKARRLQVDTGVELIVVDYLQLARSRNLENRVQEVAEISQGLKNLARELKVPVLALSQLSRAVEQRGIKQPQLADLRESGCLYGNSLVTLASTGQRMPIKKLVGKTNITILAMNKSLKIVPTKASRIFATGTKPVFKLSLKSGREIKATANHKFYTMSGWNRLDALNKGDKLAVPRQINTNFVPTANLSEDKLVLLAHLIGDGCYLKRQPLHYTNSDMLLINRVAKAAKAEFLVNTRLVPQSTWFHLYLSSKSKLARGKRNPIVKWLDEDLKIFNQHSRQKRIPKVIFSQSSENISLFLRHLWATDGCIHINKRPKGPKVRIYYASGNKRLCRDVFHLLLKLGVLSTISRSQKKGYQDMWNVQIQGKTEQMKFLTTVGIFGKKDNLVKKATKLLKDIKENPNNDIVPKEIWQEIEKQRIKQGLSTRRFHSLLGWAYSGTQRHTSGISRKRLEKILTIINSNKLNNFLHSDLYWDEINAITYIGNKPVYDITVPVHSSFIANDIIVHNSIEQDADVVMFLWREDDENLENMKLSIAKHRNGPLGQIDLHFRGDRIKFYNKDKTHAKK